MGITFQIIGKNNEPAKTLRRFAGSVWLCATCFPGIKPAPRW